MTHHTDAERAEFEAWARNQYPSIDLTRDGNDYSKALAKDYWSLWQAARSATASQSRVPMLFNPFNGRPRHPLDVQSDPYGLLIAAPNTELRAAPITQEKNG